MLLKVVFDSFQDVRLAYFFRQTGWQKCDEGFVPLQTSIAPAPEKMLRVIRCNCQAECSTMRCTCNKHNIECTPACGNCRGSGCTNTPCDNDEDDDDIVEF